MIRHVVFLAVVALFASSCKSKFLEVKNSGNVSLKYAEGIRYYNEGEYDKSIDLMEDVRPYYLGQKTGEIVFYFLAKSYLQVENLDISAFYFEELAKDYPKSQYLDEALYQTAVNYYNLSPKYKRDQKYTDDAITAFQNYIDRFPRSVRRDTVNRYILELEAKKQTKWLEVANLYFSTKRYKAAVVAYDNFLDDFVGSPYTELAQFRKIQASFVLADKSIEIKKKQRVYDALALVDNFVKYYSEESKFYIELAEIKTKLDKLKIEVDAADEVSQT